jgi:hypothetical protein
MRIARAFVSQKNISFLSGDTMRQKNFALALLTAAALAACGGTGSEAVAINRTRSRSASK